jgi:uncharacterized membrane protein
MKALELFSPEDRERIKLAIGKAEMQTSGEIRVYIDDECKEDVMDQAAFVFAELNMHRTELRNGVLIYLAVEDHKFAIIGDAGIHAKVGDQFWNKIKAEMILRFKDGKVTEALEVAILEAGEQLKQFFPRSSDDKNELPDDMVFGKGGKS